MDELFIRSYSEFVLLFHSKKYHSDGSIATYAVELKARNFHASFVVDNNPIGWPPSIFFDELAKEWTGWSGTKEWRAFEDEYSLFASIDSTGHITLAVECSSYVDAPCWSGTLWLVIEAGQLTRLASDTKDFFATRQAFVVSST